MNRPDPVQVAWLASGRPEPDRPRRTVTCCCRCGGSGPGYPASGTGAAVSDAFSDWDRLRWRDGDGFCVACTWVFTTAELRWYGHTVTHESMTRHSPTELAALLSHPLGETATTTVPVSMKKHLLPFAVWGAVATDAANLPWTRAEADLLGVYLRLRTVGFGAAAMAEPVPRWTLTVGLDPQARDEVLGLWSRLTPWRGTPYLDVAARAARRDPT